MIIKEFLLIVCLVLGCSANLFASDGIIPVDFESAQFVKGAPSGWKLDLKKGKPVIKLFKSQDSFYIHLYSHKSSYGIKKGAKVDIREYPYLNWEWAAGKLPKGGDVRKASTDDQALQLYVAFPAIGWPESLHTPIIGYVWCNEAPKDTCCRSPQIGGGKLKYFVLRNKTDKLNQWHAEKRNVYEDFKNVFPDINGGEPPGPTQGVEIYINTQHTGSPAEGYVGRIYFSKS